jgi:probable phosphoglycerate mutase
LKIDVRIRRNFSLHLQKCGTTVVLQLLHYTREYSPVDSMPVFYALRHGESLANVAGIIVSDPQNGEAGYGLSDRGRSQAEQVDLSMITAVTQTNPAAKISIYASTFRRAFETASIVASRLQPPCTVNKENRLWERSFGQWELQSNTNYDKVWEQDAIDATACVYGEESVYAVRARLIELLREISSSHQPEDVVVLVSHGDTLQILQTLFEGVDASQHRSLKHLETCELRRLGPLPKDVENMSP